MKRGSHKSTTKKVKKVLAKIENLPSVEAVIIGHSIGGKSLGRGASEGLFKIQREEGAGFKGVVQTSKGIQEIFIRIRAGKKEAFVQEIEPIAAAQK